LACQRIKLGFKIRLLCDCALLIFQIGDAKCDATESLVEVC